jgi:hypothetical protein
MLKDRRQKTPRLLMSPSNFHPPRTENCNIDAAPETGDFDLNRFKIARVEESHTEQSSPCRWVCWGKISMDRYSNGLFQQE